MASPGAPVWLLLYFLLNLALTLYNKLVLIHFPFPYTLTALHALCGSAGTFFLLKRRQVPSVQGKEAVVVLLFSVLYTVNIIVSNASLKLVTVPFHQCVRASAPLFTIALSALLIRTYSSSRAKLVSLVPVIAGVALATYGDYYFTLSGFLLTLLGTLLAALKTIITHLLQQSKSQSPPNLPLTSPTRDRFLYPPLPVSGPFQFPQRSSLSDAPPTFYSRDSNSSNELQRRVLLRSFSSGPAIDDSVPTPQFHRAPGSCVKADSDKMSGAHNNTRPTHTSTASLIYTRIHSRFLTLSSHLLSPTRHRDLSSVLLSKLDIPKLSLTPLQLLYLLSPLAFIQTTLLAYFTGELERVSWHLHDVALAAAGGMVDATGVSGSTTTPNSLGAGITGGSILNANAWWGATLLPQFDLGGGFVYSGTSLTESLARLAGGLGGGMATAPRFWLLLNGVLAFSLNVVSFEANRRVGAVGMSVAANVKQVLAVLFSVTLFNLSISSTNALGIALTIFGGAWYAYVEIQEKKSRCTSLPSLNSNSPNPPHSSMGSPRSPSSPRLPMQTRTQTKHKVSGPVLDYPTAVVVEADPDPDVEETKMEQRRRHREIRGDGQV